MSGRGPLGPIAFRAYGRFNRDARLILVTSLVTGAVVSLWWIDFNLYLVSLGYSTATIGLVATLASVAGGIIAFPASAASDRVGRRAIFFAGLIAGCIALVALLASEALIVIILAAALWSMGFQAFQVVISPYMTEHSEPDHRNELFAVQFAIQNVTNIAAAILGGLVATWLAGVLGFDPGGPGVYRIILVIMLGLSALGLVTVARLTDDRPSRTERGADAGARRAGGLPGGSATLPDAHGHHDPRPGTVLQARLPGVPDLDRGRAGHPVPQPVRAGQVRAGPDPAQRGVRAHLAGHGAGDPVRSPGWRGGSGRSRPWSSSRGVASRS